MTQPPVRFVDAPERPTFGHVSRWLINKAADGSGWLLHEPLIGQDSPGAVLCRSFEIACTAFAHFHAADKRRLAEEVQHSRQRIANFTPRT